MRTTHCPAMLVAALATGLVLTTTAPAAAATPGSAAAVALPRTAEVATSRPLAQARKRLFPVRANAHAYGSKLSNHALASSGGTASSQVCTRTYPRKSRNVVLASKPALDSVAQLEAVVSTNRTHRVNGRPAVTSTSRIAAGTLLDGLVRFEGLRSFSRVVKTASGFRRESSTQLAKLKIAGLRVALPSDNRTRRFGLPGVGELTLNARSGRTGASSAVTRSVGLRLTLLGGAKLRLARSQAALTTGKYDVFRGGAWGTEVPTVLGLVEAGRTTHKALPCQGTGGAWQSKNTLGLTVPGVLQVDETKAEGRTQRLRHRRASAVTRSTLQDVSLLGGVVQVGVVEGEARTLRRTDGSVQRNAKARIVGLRIAGEEHEIPATGRVLEVEGVARVESRVVDHTRRGVGVVALRVTLLEGLPEPVVVDLGVANAAVMR